MRKVAIVFLLAAGLIGCATKYQNMGFGGGVTAQAITNDTYRIVARGNGYTSGTAIQDYVLLKAAETAVAAGQTHFAILGADDASSDQVGQTAGSSQTNVIGNTAMTTYQPGTVYNIHKPGKDVYVRVFTPRKGEALPSGSFAADEIIANIGPRVPRDG
ncbi:hypothetical protein CU048_12150 [Beijerinckiaceae bacterium]|nr:hypothetical protein CU048_12150 [Beijerinckiaceae bacterium]